LYLKSVQFSEIRAQGIASMSITPQESRAARGLLNWTQTQLAHASLVGLSTVRNFEAELRETTVANLAAIRGAFEKAGVIFDSDGKFVGVKLKIKRGK
jgi:transcriptional regulator with XRE-family HTH domain